MKKAPNGEPFRFFEEAMKLETDECILWPFALIGKGYGRFAKDYESFRVHTEALRRRKGECPPGKHAAHDCRNKNCINYRHLNWKTPLENNHDRYRDGTYLGPRGANNILSQDHIHWIRHQLELGHTAKRISLELKAAHSTIRAIKQGRNWKWLQRQEPYIKIWRNIGE